MHVIRVGRRAKRYRDHDIEKGVMFLCCNKFHRRVSWVDMVTAVETNLFPKLWLVRLVADMAEKMQTYVEPIFRRSINR